MNKILIIEDDQLVAEIYRNKFQSEGFDTELAIDGQAGLEMVLKFRPDAIILDLMLPKLNGVEVIKALRSDPQFKALPIIVFSNSYLSDLVQGAWRAGATSCLIKTTCPPSQLIEVVKKALDRARHAAAVAAATPPPAPKSEQPAAYVSLMAPAPENADESFQFELRRAFLESVPEHLSGIRANLQTFIKKEGDETRLSALFDLYRMVHSFSSNAGLTGLKVLAKMAGALEALIKELHDKPSYINNSTVRTLAQTVDFLGVLAGHTGVNNQVALEGATVIAVDDEVISRKAVTFALEKADLKVVSIGAPEAAFDLLTNNTFDLVVLDVDMPGMTGFELCQKIRVLPAHKKTPIVFVTGMSDFDSRTKSALSGGNDLIAKPFLFMELAVKALTHVIKHRISSRQA